MPRPLHGERAKNTSMSSNHESNLGLTLPASCIICFISLRASSHVYCYFSNGVCTRSHSVHFLTSTRCTRWAHPRLAFRQNRFSFAFIWVCYTTAINFHERTFWRKEWNGNSKQCKSNRSLIQTHTQKSCQAFSRVQLGLSDDNENALYCAWTQ